ncbi:hypothetical protein K0M31_001780 [Melipona bicolor]|uniref:Uncharacterized protein n=1 Tax=Melipona bicolor TaxID=60889 RepID=A0AA40GG95_9HYME|nr:hypothetical protein K0M31_001780 [Melipona bicolor]
MLQERAENLMFSDAQIMFEIIAIIRKKFSESASRSIDNNRLAGGIKMADDLFGLKFENEEIKSFTIKAKFDKAEYEEKLNEYYEKYSPIISRRAFKNTIIDKLRSKNSESAYLGFGTIELTQYIIENRECIVALNSDFIVQRKSNVVIDGLVTTYFEEEEQLWKDAYAKTILGRSITDRNVPEEFLYFCISLRCIYKRTAADIKKRNNVPQNAEREDSKMFEEVSTPLFQNLNSAKCESVAIDDILDK